MSELLFLHILFIILVILKILHNVPLQLKKSQMNINLTNQPTNQPLCHYCCFIEMNGHFTMHFLSVDYALY